jgi:Predicted membrane protein (DUF2254)
MDALIILSFRPGQFVLRGEPLAAIVPASNAHALEAAISRGIHIGRHRTLTQDSEFGIAQVVEIAIRALSPAVNDTFTGVACVDWLAEALLTLAERPPLEGNWYDTGGRLRVWMPPVRLERLAKFAFDQIRQASATTPAVLIRQLDAIRRLAPRLPDGCRQRCRIKRTRSWKPRARWSRLIAATSMRRGSGHTPRSKRCPGPQCSESTQEVTRTKPHQLRSAVEADRQHYDLRRSQRPANCGKRWQSNGTVGIAAPSTLWITT